jgi:hypothetical protein
MVENEISKVFTELNTISLVGLRIQNSSEPLYFLGHLMSWEMRGRNAVSNFNRSSSGRDNGNETNALSFW